MVTKTREINNHDIIDYLQENQALLQSLISLINKESSEIQYDKFLKEIKDKFNNKLEIN
jgi:hypothetical protein